MIEPNLIQTKYSEVINPSNFWETRPFAEPVALSELGFLLTSEQLGSDRLNHLNNLLNRLSQVCQTSDELQAGLLLYLYPSYKAFPDRMTQQLCHPNAYEIFLRLRQIDGLSFKMESEKHLIRARDLIYAMCGNFSLMMALLLIRLHRIQQFEDLPASHREVVAKQSLHVYAPLANRLGIFWIKAELEDHAFQILEPDQYYQLKKLVAKKRNERSALVESMSRQIRQTLRKAGLNHQVYGRYKRFYSIHEKLQKVDHQFERIQDLIALRILLDDVADCYAALSYIHERWSHNENRFKDYITQPKPNGYQSLHTTVTTSEGDDVEIQIRTHEMHAVAEFGIAAHWLYKETHRRSAVKADLNKSFKKLDQALQCVYPMTPQGDILELPIGASPVDFAYHIHTDIGNQIAGVKINNNISKIDSQLENGDCVEILTSPRQHPTKEWLNFVKTHKARNKIRQFVNLQKREEFRRDAWNILEKDFRQAGLNLNRMVRENRLENECQQRKSQSFEHVLNCIGQGSLRSQEILQWFIDAPNEFAATPTIQPKNKKTSLSIKTHFIPGKFHVCVEGLEEAVTSLAGCCKPVPGDDIIGYISKNRMIKIHKKNCVSASHLENDQLLAVNWIELT
ncbi:MAG: TGS domain-containing protein [Deltaproteobacteria bacterium]